MLLSRLALAIIIMILLQLVNIIHITSASKIYKASPFYLNRVYAETPPQQQLQSGNLAGEDACILGSLPYISLIMNVTHKNRKESLGNPISDITKILDDSHQENNNTIDAESYKTGTSTTMQNRSNETDAK